MKQASAFRTMRRRSLSHALQNLSGERLKVNSDTALAERLRDLAADQKQAVGESDQAELLARLLPPSHLPPELVAALCAILPGLLAEDSTIGEARENSP